VNEDMEKGGNISKTNAHQKNEGRKKDKSARGDQLICEGALGDWERKKPSQKRRKK